MLTYTSENNRTPELMYWGLIPFWVKNAKSAKEISNKTLNARIESLSEKPSYRHIVDNKRCVLHIDSFFEYFHYKGKTYPFRIYMDEPFGLACLWDQWIHPETKEKYKTFSIVTTHANQLMSKIHNNPKLHEPRMPVIVNEEDEEKWLDNNLKYSDLQLFNCPFPDGLLKTYTVGNLREIGNNPEALVNFDYQELTENNFI
jgi:putative SOS response-associated peptidase YedK